MTGGLILAAVLILVGLATALRQRRALRALADEPFMPDEDRTYRRGQARRRMATSALLVLIGALIANYYLSGMDTRMDAIGDREKLGIPPRDEAQAEADKQFTRFVGFYWICVVVPLFLAMCMAVMDFRATRKYWMARYKELKTDYDTRLQRDLAVYRQQKLNTRVPGLKPPTDDDTATDL